MMPKIDKDTITYFGERVVNHLWFQTGGWGLHLDSTAIQHTFASVLLWLPCPMH